MTKKLILLVFLLQSLLLNTIFAESRPLIGITPSFSKNSIQLNNDYVTAINENGGLAIILPPTANDDIIETYVKMLDGVVFSGGPDIPPDFYGQTPHSTTEVMEPTRFEFEKRFIKAFLDSGKPVLGICLGMQFSNVVSGGTMIQDIPSTVGTRISHRNGEMYTNFHRVGIARNSRLCSILKQEMPRVISRHHQAVDKVADRFLVISRSHDGVIEAIERKDNVFGIFVQWHPESLKDADPEHRNRIFKALVEASSNVRATRNQD